MRHQSSPMSRNALSRGFTLLELLAVVAVFGIAGALLIPSMGATGVLRIQAAVRTVISDITFAQSDAVAFQERRAIVFDTETSTYRVVMIPGDEIDIDTNTMYDPTQKSGKYIINFNHEAFGGARISDVNFDGGNSLIFDSLGGPVADPATDEPGSGGTVTITGADSTFIVTVEAFTGRVSVAREQSAEPPPPPGGSGGSGG